MSKLSRAITHINAANSADERLPRLKKDLADLEDQFEKLIFYEVNEQLSDEQWAEQEKQRELATKKLMTVANSKWFMMRVSYAKLFESIDFE